CGCTCQKRRCSRPLTHGLHHGETGTPSALSCSNTSTEPGLRSAHTTSARTKCRLRLMIAAQLDLNCRTPAQPRYPLLPINPMIIMTRLRPPTTPATVPTVCINAAGSVDFEAMDNM